MTFEEFTARYHFDRRTDLLGRGGFGSVYKAYDTFLDSDIAIKIAEVDLNNQKFRLLHEFNKAKTLPTHSNIAQYQECFTFTFQNGEYDYALMKYYELGNLQQLLAKNTLTVDDKISLLKEILNGIELLHKNNIIHRDLKPENILIALRPNGAFVPKIADFGISKVMDENKTLGTNTVVGGTFSYSSPEQLVGGEIRKNTDLWSFGILICRLFTGRTPFHSGSLDSQSHVDQASLVTNILNEPLHSDFLNIPSPFNRVVELCLQKKSADRVKDASALKELLNNDSIPITSIPRNELNTLPDVVKSNSNLVLNESEKIINEQKLSRRRENESWGNYGFVDQFNRPIIPFAYEVADEFSGGLAKVGKLISKRLVSEIFFGFVDEQGREVIPVKYDGAESFSEGLAPVRIKLKWGYIDKYNMLKIEPIYEQSKSFSSGLACVKLNGKFGFINSGNKMLIPLVYDYASSFRNECAVVGTNGKLGLINLQNQVIIPLIYDNIKFQKDKFFKVCINEKWGLVDVNNNGVIPLIYQELGNYQKTTGLIRARKNDKYGFIDIKNRIVIDFEFMNVSEFHDGTAKGTKTANFFSKDKEYILRENDYLIK